MSWNSYLLSSEFELIQPIVSSSLWIEHHISMKFCSSSEKILIQVDKHASLPFGTWDTGNGSMSDITNHKKDRLTECPSSIVENIHPRAPLSFTCYHSCSNWRHTKRSSARCSCHYHQGLSSLHFWDAFNS